MSTCFSLTHEQLAQSGYEYTTQVFTREVACAWDEDGYITETEEVSEKWYIVHAKNGNETLALREVVDLDNPKRKRLFCNAFRSLADWAKQFAIDANASISGIV